VSAESAGPCQTTQGGLHGGHQQRGGHPLSGDIGDGDPDAILVGRDEVVIVAAHTARWFAKTRQFHRSAFGYMKWKESSLNFCGQAEFAIQSLLNNHPLSEA
jgi:hypothetical protein